MTTEQKLKHIDLHVGQDGAWVELKTESGKSFCFQPMQEFGPESHWRKYVLEWASEMQRYALTPAEEPNVAGICDYCGGKVLHRPGKPGEYDHECSSQNCRFVSTPNKQISNS